MTEKRDVNDDHDTGESAVRLKVRQIVHRLAPDPIAPTRADHHLVRDLGYHSLALLEMAFALEETFSLPPIDAPVVGGIQTIRDVEDLVLTQLRERGGAA